MPMPRTDRRRTNATGQLRPLVARMSQRNQMKRRLKRRLNIQARKLITAQIIGHINARTEPLGRRTVWQRLRWLLRGK